MNILYEQEGLNLIKPNMKSINSAKIILEPVEPGLGHTLGNALRRILLSLIPGFGITSVEIEGIKHIYNNKIGIKEDIIEVLLNLREIYIKLPDKKNEAKLYLKKKGLGPVYAQNIDLPDGVEIINKEKIICNITDDNVSLNLSMIVNRGLGYIADESQSNQLENDLLAGKLYMDVNFNPIKKVNYTVVSKFYEDDEKYLDCLILDIVTNGTISAEDSVRLASKILYDQLQNFIDLKYVNYRTLELEEKKKEKKLKRQKVTLNLKFKSFLYRTLEELEGINLKTAFILKKEADASFVGDVINYTEEELLKIITQKSIDQLNNIFKPVGFYIGMDINKWSLENKKHQRMYQKYLRIKQKQKQKQKIELQKQKIELQKQKIELKKQKQKQKIELKKQKQKQKQKIK